MPFERVPLTALSYERTFALRKVKARTERPTHGAGPRADAREQKGRFVPPLPRARSRGVLGMSTDQATGAMLNVISLPARERATPRIPMVYSVRHVG